MAVFALTDPSGLAWRVFVAYLLGAVPFGLVMCRLFKGVDLREFGSGNIGATNAMRVLGKPLGLLAFLLDLGKGYAPVALLAGGDPLWQVACGAGAVCGHVWPLYLRFKGGKAVATGCGALLAINPLIPLVAGLAWFLALLVAHYVSIASMVMGVAFPVTAWALGEPGVVIAGSSGLMLLIFVRHRSNVSRLLDGTETRTDLWSQSKNPSEDADDGEVVEHD